MLDFICNRHYFKDTSTMSKQQVQLKEKELSIEDLIVSRMYKVSYMPTKYLYERVGKLISKTETTLKFTADYDGWYFDVQPKHLINIEEDKI